MRHKNIRGIAMSVALGIALPLSPIFARPMSSEPTHVSPSPVEKGVAYREMAHEITTSLDQHILDPWFPHAVDTTQGGFHQNFANDWQPLPEDKRGVVYQSRLTWVAAQAALHAPKGSEAAIRWQKTALHGLDYLTTTLWDQEKGGFYFEVTPEGKPETERHGAKHVYGIGFGIYAACAVFEATHDPRALSLARRAFDYLEKYAHDAKNGGYTEALDRKGQAILTASVPGENDVIGTPYGYKSMNSHIHILEALTALYAIDPKPIVRTRLEETFLLVRDRIVVSPGCMNLYFTPDWRAVPGQDSFGHDVETAFLLQEAAHVLGKEDARTRFVSRQLVDHALAYGWDETNGGFYDEGTAFGKPVHTAKIWWTQGEGLNALLLMHSQYGKETPRYWEAFLKQWDFINRYQIDSTNKGWRTEVTVDGKADPQLSKSDFWKDPYHQGRALFMVTETLEQLALKH